MTINYRCQVCGYIYVGNKPPENCPVCGALTSEFDLYDEKVTAKKETYNSWRCLNCEYIHQGSKAPEICPVCGVKKENFEPYFDKKPGISSKDNIKILIIGAGIAGLSAAEEIRKNSKKANVILICAEKQPPYYTIKFNKIYGRRN